MVWAQLSALCTEPAQESPEADWKQAGRGAGDFGAAVEVARRQGFGSAACAGVPACSRGAGSKQVGCDFRFSIPTSRPASRRGCGFVAPRPPLPALFLWLFSRRDRRAPGLGLGLCATVPRPASAQSLLRFKKNRGKEERSRKMY